MAPTGDQTSPAQGAKVDEVVAVLKFANQVGSAPAAQRETLSRHWEQRYADSGGTGCAALHLALLLGGPGQSAPRDLTRARELYKSYLSQPEGKSQVLLDFARLQLAFVDERERWHRQVQQERQAREALERKLEALKSIELRMNDKDSRDKVPLPGP